MKKVVGAILGMVILATLFVAFSMSSCYFKGGFEKDLCIVNKVDTFGFSSYCEQAHEPNVCYKFAARLNEDPKICDNLQGIENDKCLGLTAIQTKTKSLCMPIVDSTIKNQCLMQVFRLTGDASTCANLNGGFDKDQCYLQAGLMNLDEDLCKKTTYSDECYFGVGMAKKDVSICELSSNQKESDYCKLELSNCDEIGTDALKFYCKAQKENDAEKCLEINDYNLQRECIASFDNLELCNQAADTYGCYEEFAVKKADPSLCLSGDDLCKINVAVENKKPSICENVEDKNTCYEQIAEIIADPSLCHKLSKGKTIHDMNNVDLCLQNAAKASGDESICDGIGETVPRDGCKLYVRTDNAIKTGNPKLCENNFENYGENIDCYYRVALKTKDYHVCETIDKLEGEYDTYTSKCYKNVLLAKQEEFIDQPESNITLPKNNYCKFESQFDSTPELSELYCEMDTTLQYQQCQLLDKSYKPACYVHMTTILDNQLACLNLADEYDQKVCLRTYAEVKHDPKICKLLPEDAQDSCIINVAGVNEQSCSDFSEPERCYFEKAKETGDESYCNKITDKDNFYYSQCYMEMAIANNEPELCDKADLKDDCLSAVAKANGLENCELVQDDTLKYYCYQDKSELHYLPWIQETCNGEKQYEKDYCNLRKAVIANSSSKCSQLKIGEIKDICYYELSVQKQVDHCSDINLPNAKDNCNAEVGELLRSQDMCLKIKDEYSHDKCLSNIAFLTGNDSLCTNLKGDSFRSFCGQLYI